MTFFSSGADFYLGLTALFERMTKTPVRTREGIPSPMRHWRMDWFFPTEISGFLSPTLHAEGGDSQFQWPGLKQQADSNASA
jgi:hypothetical protein